MRIAVRCLSAAEEAKIPKHFQVVREKIMIYVLIFTPLVLQCILSLI